MSTNLVHILTVAGKAAREVEAVCDELGSRSIAGAHSPGSSGWSSRDQRVIASFCQSLIRAAHELPVVHYSLYIDSWSMGNRMFDFIDWPDVQRRRAKSSNFSFAYYPSARREQINSDILKGRRSKSYRTSREVMWYLDHVWAAFDAADWLNTNYVVVAITQSLGGSRHDEEIKASLQSTIRLPRIKKRRRPRKEPRGGA